MRKEMDFTEIENDCDAFSDMLKEVNEPVYIMKDGKRDLVAMSIECYERMFGSIELNAENTIG